MRARPVADAPVEALLRAREELARDWLLALVGAAPLNDAQRVPVAEVAAHGPSLVEAVVRALRTDDALTDVTAAPDVGALAGARGPAETAAAVEALRAVLWRGLRDELRRPSPDQVADLADRLAAVCSMLVASPGAPRRDGPAQGDPAPVPAAAEAVESPVVRAARAVAERASTVVRPPPPPTGSPPTVAEPAPPAPLQAPVSPPETEPRTHDARARPPRDGALGLLDGALVEHAASGRPFAVLAVELEGIERLLAAEVGDEVVRAVAAAEAAVLGLLRPQDGAIHEGTGRWWILLPDAGRATARAMALRLRTAVARAAAHRGRALAAAVGVATCPRDGEDAETLLEAADDALLAARAAGV